MAAMKKIFDLSKERDAKDATTTSSARALTPPQTGSSIPATTKTPLVSSGRDQPYVEVISVEVKDHASFSPINNIRHQDQDQSPFQEKSLDKQARLFEDASIGHLHLNLSFQSFYCLGSPHFSRGIFFPC